MKRLLLWLALIAASYFMLSCSWWRGDCNGSMNQVRDDYGAPEDTYRYDAGTYHSVSWWYWSKGKSFTFTWSSDRDCERSVFTFNPIRKPVVTDEDKAYAERHKVLVEQDQSSGPCPVCPAIR